METSYIVNKEVQCSELVMTERHNTLVCTFDPASPRITAFDIHEWIYTALRLPEGDVQMIQIDGVRRQVFIKMANSEKVLAVLRDKGEQVDYMYPTGETFSVSLAVAGMGMKRVRIANLPPEVPNDTLKASLAPYGKVIEVQIEKWSNVYRYAVANGIRQVTFLLTKHAPSHLTVAGHRVLLSYEGQPATCYGCGGVGHMFQGCPARQGPGPVRPRPAHTTYASAVSPTAAPSKPPTKDTQIMDKQRPMQECTASNTVMNAPRRETRAHNVDTGEPSQMAQTTPPTGGGAQEGPTVENPDREVERYEKDEMETETSRADLTIGDGEELDSQDMLTDPQLNIQNTEDQPAKTEGVARGADRPETKPTHSDDGKTGKEVGCSPKRSKKMRVDKPGETSRERSRSAPRRASFKGKT